MILNIYQVDAFTDQLFGGNPAAVVPLTSWLPDDLMQKIALENNLSETAFYVKTANGFHIRWFTPSVEVALCGHATLASSYVIFNRDNYEHDTILFDSKSGILKVTQNGNWLTLDFPAQKTIMAEAPENLVEGMGKNPVEIYRAIDDYLLIYASEQEVAALSPNFTILEKVKARGIIATAPAKSKELDFVSRFFAPASGINEDPVTGSAHTKLVPFWSARLAKTDLIAEQISARKGFLKCQLKGDRVLMSGQGKLFLKGEIYIE